MKFFFHLIPLLLGLVPIVSATYYSTCEYSARTKDCDFKNLDYTKNEPFVIYQPKLKNGTVMSVSFTNSQLIRLPGEIFSAFQDVIKMNASNTQLTNLDKTAFNHAIFLQEFYCDGNAIQRLNNFTFQGASRLTKISITRNKIRKIQQYAFFFLNSLEELVLSHNFIHFMKNTTFMGMSQLKRIWLDDNRVTILVDGLFNDSPKLEEIYLHSNNIVAISGQLLLSQYRLKTLMLDGNVCCNSNFTSESEVIADNLKMFKNCTDFYEVLRARNETDQEDPDEPDSSAKSINIRLILTWTITISCLVIFVTVSIGAIIIRSRRLPSEYVINYNDSIRSESTESDNSAGPSHSQPRKISFTSAHEPLLNTSSRFTETVARSYESCIRNSEKTRKDLLFKIMGPLKRRSYDELF